MLQPEETEKNLKEVPESDDDCMIVDVEPPEPVSPPKTVRTLYIRYYGAFALPDIDVNTETDKLTHSCNIGVRLCSKNTPTQLYATHFYRSGTHHYTSRFELQIN